MRILTCDYIKNDSEEKYSFLQHINEAGPFNKTCHDPSIRRKTSHDIMGRRNTNKLFSQNNKITFTNNEQNNFYFLKKGH